MKKGKIVVAFLVVLCIVLTAACSAGTMESASGTSESTASQESTSATESTPSENTELSGDTVYIGLVSFFTGSLQSVGDYAKQGVQLALDKINAEGGIMGHPVEAKYFDGIDSQQATVNAVKLALEDKELSYLIVCSYGAYTLAAMPYIEEAGMPTLVTCTAQSVVDAQNPYIWLLNVTDKYVGAALANFAVNEIGSTNPAIWHVTTDNAVATKDVIVEKLSGMGIEVPESMIFASASGEQNLAPIAAQIKASGCDCLLVYSAAADAGLLAKALQDAGLDVPVVGHSAVSQNYCLDIAGDAIDGWYAVATYVPTEQREYVQEFIAAASAAGYGSNPDSGIAMLYDSCFIFKAACEAAGSVTDLDLINNSMATINGLERVLGITTAKEDHTLRADLSMVQWNGDVLEYVSTETF